MSTTTTINPANSGNNSSEGKKHAAAFAATAAGAAGLGVAGTHIVSELGESEDILTDGNVLTGETIEEIAHQNNESTATETISASTSPTTPNSSSTTSNATSTSTTVEPQPITNGDIVEPIVSIEQTTEPATEVETEVTVETEPVEQTNTAQNEVVNPEVVSPDEIVEAIIAEDKIDPNDIDMADVINFDDIGTVYTVDGESYTAAAFHDAAGNNLIMVDVDGDNVFDVITDYDGNLIAEVPGNLSVGDAQEDIADDDVYLAYDNEMDNVDEYGDDSLADDLMA